MYCINKNNMNMPKKILTIQEKIELEDKELKEYLEKEQRRYDKGLILNELDLDLQKAIANKDSIRKGCGKYYVVNHLNNYKEDLYFKSGSSVRPKPEIVEKKCNKSILYEMVLKDLNENPPECIKVANRKNSKK